MAGFTRYWGPLHRGAWVIKRKTATTRLKRALAALSKWCSKHLHLSIKEQHQKLTQKLRGHHGYYGIIGSSVAQQIVGAICERLGRATMVALDSVVFFPVPI
jgi:RNA-directed DNA polymerase